MRLVKRHYRSTGVVGLDGGFAVTLDGRPLRTPGKHPLLLPREKLAHAIAGEWQGQGERIAPASLRLTRLANGAIDVVGPARATVEADILGYADTDLVCYRAAGPDSLIARQHETWQPLLDWATTRFGAALGVTRGILPITQPDEVRAALAEPIGAMDDFVLAGLHAAVAAAGSIVIGLALAEARIDAEAAWQAALADEIFQAEQWGADAEAESRRAALRQDIAAAGAFMALCRA